MTIKTLVISDYRSSVSSRPEAEMFIGLKKAGVDVEIMTYGDAEYVSRFREAGIRVIEYHPDAKYSREAVNRIRQELIQGGHHILHLFNNKAIINGIRAARKLPVKVVLYRGYTGNINWWDPISYTKFLHPRVDKIICLAASIEEYLGRQLFFKKEKAITINKGHDPEWYAGIPRADLRELGIPAGAFVISCAANARKMKDMPTLIRSSYHLPPGLPIHYILIGNGMDNPGFLRLIGRSPYRANFHLPGYRKDSLNIVAASDVFILTSIKGEAITKSVIEAMSLGIAPIITNIPGNRDLVVHKEYGLVVPIREPRAVADAIVTLFENPAMRQLFGKKAREHMTNRLNISDTIRKTLALYEDLLKSQDRQF